MLCDFMTETSKMLVVRVGRAGDMVMITPALNALLAAFPAAELHVMTTHDGLRVLRGFHPRLTHSFVYSRKFLRNRLARRRLARELGTHRYKRIYLFETHPHYQALLADAGAPVYPIWNLAPDVHFSRRCLDAVQNSIDTPIADGWVHLPVTEQGREQAAKLLREHGIGENTCLVGFHPTSSPLKHPLRRGQRDKLHKVWPSDSFAALARLLAKHALEQGLDCRVVIDLLPGERALGEAIKEQSGGAVTLLVAPPDFERYKALTDRMSLMVTANTGPMHIAAAVRTRLVALFSGWSVLDCGPFMPDHLYTTLCAEDMLEPRRGLAAIPPELVFEACLEHLPASADHARA